MSEQDDKALAIQVIRRLWPSLRINESNVTPDVADYVFRVFVAAKEGHRVVRSLAPALGLTTSWAGLAMKLVKAVRAYTEESDDWGWAIRSGVTAHHRALQAAMDYGSGVYPLSLR